MTSPSSAVTTFDTRVARAVATAEGRRVDGPLGRFYAVNGELFPSVTHVLSCINKPALVNWAATQERTLVTAAAADLYLDLVKTPPMSRPAYVTTLQTRIGKEKAHKRALTKAADIGTQVHALIEWNLRRSLHQDVGPSPRVVDDAQWAFMAFEDWATSVALKPLLIEQTVFSRTHRFAGTMDLLAEVHGVPTLVDFKTGKAVYREAHLQNVAYQVALDEMGHGAPSAGCIVRLPKVQTDPAFEVVASPPRDALFPSFLAVLAVWRWWHEGERAYQARRADASGGARTG